MSTKESIKSLEKVQAPTLEDIYCDTKQFKKMGLDDIQAPTLTETTDGNVVQNNRMDLDGIQAPTLTETTDGNVVQNKRMGLDGIQVPTLNTTDGRQVKVVAQTTQQPKSVKSQRQQVSSSTPMVELPPQEERYVSKYANADIERAKQEGMKKAHEILTPELTEDEKKKSREAHRQLMAMREQEMAEKGGKLVKILLILGIFATVGFHLLITIPEFKDGSGADLVESLKGFIIYYDVLLALGTFLMLPKLDGFRKFSSLVFGLNTLITLTLGSFLLSQMVSIGINIAFYLVSLIFSVFIVFQLSGNENVGKYYTVMK